MSVGPSRGGIEAGSGTTQNLSKIITRKSQGNKEVQIEDEKSFEVFRSNTTAVEITVKQVSKSKPMKKCSPRLRKLPKLEEADEENEVKSQTRFDETRKVLTSLLFQMKAQLEASSNRESASQAEILALRLENAKLSTLLESKTALANKFRKELLSMRRSIKLVVKRLCCAKGCAPKMPEFTFSSDQDDYEDFEKGLKEFHLKMFEINSLDGTALTMDSTVSNKDNVTSDGK